MQYCFLADDLDFLNESFNDNSYRSTIQISEYPKPARGKTISHEQYGRKTGNDKPPLRLFTADGYDGGPVGSLGYKAARAFWYMGSDHIFLPQMDLVRLAFFFHLDLHQAAFLVVKGEWERYFARKNGYKNGMGEKFTDIMTMTPDESQFLGFTVDAKGIYESIHSLLDMVRKNAALDMVKDPGEEMHAEREWRQLELFGFNGYDEKSFGGLIQEIILNKLYFHALDAPVVRDFVAKKRHELETLQNGTLVEQQEFWMLKCTWLELQEQLGEALLGVERSRLRNARVVTDFLKIFGDGYVELQELVVAVRTLENRIMLKETRPELAAEEIIEALRRQEELDEGILKKLKSDAEMAPWIMEDESGGRADPEVVNGYLRKIKKALREIYFLFHDDHLRNHPAFDQLTDAQKNHLQELLQRAMEIKKETELCHKEGTIGHDNRSLEELMDILARAKYSLHNAGLDIKPEYEIQGETIRARIEWLEREIKQLGKSIEDARMMMIAFNADRDVREKIAILDCPARHDRVMAEIRQRIEEYRQEKSSLDARYQALFGGMAS